MHRIARRGGANELEATVPRFTGMFEINVSLGVDAPLNCFGTLAKGSCQTKQKFQKKREEIFAHTRSLHGIQTSSRLLGQQYNDLVVRILPIYREGSVVAGDAGGSQTTQTWSLPFKYPKMIAAAAIMAEQQ